MRTLLPSVSDQEFDRVVETSLVPVLVQFWKPGCGHCRALMAELELVKEMVGTSLLILTMNVEDNHQIPAELEIVSLPALAFYRDGAFARFIGGVGTCDEIVKQLELKP